MAFQFSLETVLRLRGIAEQREERAMEDILRNMAQQRQHLMDLASDRAQLVQRCDTVLQAKVPVAELVLLQGQIQVTKDREADGRKQLAHLEEQRQAQMKVYETAHRNRELLSRMREQHLEQFRRAQTRKEQMQMDDLFSCRRTSA
ncbi:MAG: flagellar export protein FliJ [Janthinobacterium lividum]